MTSGRGLRRDAVRNRERLLAAAEQVFVRSGIEAGVEAVVRTAGVGIRTLYRGFEQLLISAATFQAAHRGSLARLRS